MGRMRDTHGLDEMTLEIGVNSCFNFFDLACALFNLAT